MFPRQEPERGLSCTPNDYATVMKELRRCKNVSADKQKRGRRCGKHQPCAHDEMEIASLQH